MTSFWPVHDLEGKKQAMFVWFENTLRCRTWIFSVFWALICSCPLFVVDLKQAMLQQTLVETFFFFYATVRLQPTNRYHHTGVEFVQLLKKLREIIHNFGTIPSVTIRISNVTSYKWFSGRGDMILFKWSCSFPLVGFQYQRCWKSRHRDANLIND